MCTTTDDFSDFIVFLDDGDERREWFVNITEINVSYITFKSKKGNVHIIPIYRILKIKRKDDG